MNPSKERLLDLSWGSIVKIFVAVLGLYVFFLIKDILLWLILGMVISILFNPVIEFFVKFKVPRVAAAVGIYLASFGLLALMIYAMTPFFTLELQRFSGRFPEYFNSISPPLRDLGLVAFSDVQELIDVLNKNAQDLASGVLNGLFAVLGGIISAIFILSMALFVSLEERTVERAISFLFPKRYETLAFNLWRRSQKRVSGWFLSRIISSLFVGLLTYFTLLIFDVRYPVSLSVIAGITNFVPIVGPLIAGFLIAIIVGLDSPLRALFMVGAFTLIQQIENNVLTPLLSRRFVGLHPVLVLVSLAVGGRLWGIIGAFLAVPLAGILFEFLHDFLERKKKAEEEAAD
ncbi:MAG: AI-2E family transporter [Parcubacteria group bacterium]|nr:AI-2E family transporter [Parcubacteria group bacterium]